MNHILQGKINEISLLLVMTDATDTTGLEILMELCKDIPKIVDDSTNSKALVAAIQNLENFKPPSERHAAITDFVKKATKFIDGDLTVFTEPLLNDGVADQTPTLDSADKIDYDFLKDYIESHSLMLEEFEANILEYKNNPNKNDELAITVKRYLHNLKGDSGSIGLHSVERVCHTLEDIFTTQPVTPYLQHLINFKEWMCECLKAFAAKEQPLRSAERFLNEIKSLPVDLLVDTDHSKVSSKLNNNLDQISPPTNSEKALTNKTYALTGEMDILLEFSTEAEEHLGNVEGVVLDTDGDFSKDSIDTIFRCVHSLKGGSAYFNLVEMTKCSHILENYLSEVRDGTRNMDRALSDLIMVYIDLQKDVLKRAKSAVRANGQMIKSSESIKFLDDLEKYGKGENIDVSSITKIETKIITSDTTDSPSADLSGNVASTGTKSTEVKNKEDKLDIKTFVKVETGRLDNLIDSIGEMTIYSSMLIRQCRDLLADNAELMDATHRVEKISRDLQDVGMSMRLVPIKGLFQKMSRLVWDTSKKIGKEINFIMEGEDTELDRNLIDKLADPLMHMVRNSIDHGIEAPEERIKKGKSKVGKVTLSAYHAGGSIHIKITDDGKGLDPDKLIAKAIEKGIIQEGQKLTHGEAFQLIFAAGFSTAAQVTDLSGRGVGMDVVRRNVESLRGRIMIDSKVDHGSTFTIELPLTLAIIDGIQVRVGSENFIIPSLSIVEFLQPSPDMISYPLDQGETLQFRGKFLPIYRLSKLYGFDGEFNDPLDATMIIVEYNQELVAFMVDEILGEYSTVIKSLGSIFEEGKGIAGCAIMPKGNVALILDILSLVQLARKTYSHKIDTASDAFTAMLH